jgi:hypothetical protein
MADDMKEAGGVVTGLVTRSVEFGKGLIDAAQTENRAVVQRNAVGKVQELLVKLQKQRDYQARVAENIAFLERKIAALDTGEFATDAYGGIRWTEAELNEDRLSNPECFNCGANAQQPYRR